VPDCVTVEEVEMSLLAGDEHASSLDGHDLSDAPDGDSEESVTPPCP